MRLNLYNDQLERVAIIGERFFSVFWSEGYNSAEPFTLQLPDIPEFSAKPGWFVGRADRPTLMVVEGIKKSRDSITLTGHQATRILDDLAFIGTIPANSEIDKSVAAAYNSSRRIPHLRFADTALGLRYGHQISNKSFWELAQTMCKEADCGLRVVRNGGTMEAEFYQPQKDQNNILSEKYGNVEIRTAAQSVSNYKNVAIVLGEGTGGDRVRVDVEIPNSGDQIGRAHV